MQDVGGQETTGRIQNLPTGKNYAFDVVAMVNFSGNVWLSPGTVDIDNFGNATTIRLPEPVTGK